MRIVTPQNAAFLPDGSGGSGGGGGLPLTASYGLIETVNADFGPTFVDFFVPSSGLYLFGLYTETVAAAAGGSLSVSIDQPGGPISITSVIGLDLTVIGIGGGYLGNFNIIPVLATYGVIQISRQVTGLAGSATYRITAAAYKLC